MRLYSWGATGTMVSGAEMSEFPIESMLIHRSGLPAVTPLAWRCRIVEAGDPPWDRQDLHQ